MLSLSVFSFFLGLCLSISPSALQVLVPGPHLVFGVCQELLVHCFSGASHLFSCVLQTISKQSNCEPPPQHDNTDDSVKKFVKLSSCDGLQVARLWQVYSPFAWHILFGWFQTNPSE
jgi:hypothetical protein